MTWWIASIIANACIQFTEYKNRTVEGGWDEALPWTIVPIIIAQWGLYYSFNRAPSFFVAWAFFAVGNSMMRVVSARFFIGEHVTLVTYAGIAVMLAGSYLIKEGIVK